MVESFDFHWMSKCVIVFVTVKICLYWACSCIFCRKAKIKLERLVMTNSTLKWLGKSRGSFKLQASKLSRVSFTSTFLLKPGSLTSPPAIDLNRQGSTLLPYIFRVHGRVELKDELLALLCKVSRVVTPKRSYDHNACMGDF